MLTKYILDTNVYIEAYKGYYHPDIVPVYWDILKFLGKEKTIESPKQVLHEIKSQNKPQSSKENNTEEDFLYDWSRSSDNKCFLKNDLKDIDLHFRKVQAAYETVKTKNTEKIRKRRNGWNWPRKEPVSDQDMFVIATVLFYQNYFPTNKYVLVTKESFDVPPKHFKAVKIPHICKELDVEFIDDFELLKRLGIQFNSSFNLGDQ